MSDLTRTEERFRMANPIPDPANPPAAATPAAEVLLDLERRRTMQTQGKNPTTTQPRNRRQRRRGPLVAAAAFGAVLVVGAIVLASGGDNEEPEADAATTVAPPSTATTVAPTTQPPAFTGDDALAVASALFDDYNAGDVDGVLAPFTPDVEISDSILGPWAAEEWEKLARWNAAQGTILTPPECTVTEETPGESVFVTCDSATNNAEIQAANSPPVPTIVRMIVTPFGIDSLRFGYGSPPFNDTSVPFYAWVAANHPEDREAVGFGNWTSRQDAEQKGALVAQLAEEWAVYLVANGCAYDEGC